MLLIPQKNALEKIQEEQKWSRNDTSNSFLEYTTITLGVFNLLMVHGQETTSHPKDEGFFLLKMGHIRFCTVTLFHAVQFLGLKRILYTNVRKFYLKINFLSSKACWKLLTIVIISMC